MVTAVTASVIECRLVKSDVGSVVKIPLNSLKVTTMDFASYNLRADAP
jgi:hypothetical protein